jgi:Skp family chaperone for outer membrane proteins
MKKQFLILFIVLIIGNSIQAQTRGIKIGYIDMEYILQNIPNYTEAQNQLEQKAQEWKQQVEAKKNVISKLKDGLKAEQALLTKELIDEREAEINYLETENLDYQQKRFGSNGDLMLQKSVLTKPIQDQVFTAIQDIAEAKKYDFIFDITSDLTMLFAAKRFDISDQVLRVLNRSEKREQLTKKELAAEEAKEIKEDAIDENPALAERKKALDEKKAARDKALDDRKLLQEQKKKEIEDRKKQLIIDREAKKSGGTPADSKTSETSTETDKETAKTAAAEAKQKQEDEKAKTIEDRKKAVEDRKKAVEEKRKQILEDREAKKIGLTPAESKTAAIVLEKSVDESKTTAAAEAKQKQAEEKVKILEDRKKAVEDQKKAIEEKRKQILLEREAKKTGTVSETKIIEDIKAPTTVIDTTKIVVPEKISVEDAKKKQMEARAKILEDRKKAIEDNKKALEEKKKKVLEDREAAKKANEEKLKATK